MNRTRRAALATMLGSVTLLGAETFGTTRGRLEREVSIEAVADADAYLGLTDDESHRESILFERPTGNPPATFDLLNQLLVSLDIELTFAGDLRFDAVETPAATVDLTEDALTASGLAPGETIDGISLDLDRRHKKVPLYGERVTGTLEIEADGEDVGIEADRSLELTSDVLLVVDLCDVRALPDVLVVIRKRTADRSLPTLVVETIDCVGGDSSVVDRHPQWSERPFELALPSLSSVDRRRMSVHASSQVAVSVRDDERVTDPESAGAARNAGDERATTVTDSVHAREHEDRTMVAVDPADGSAQSADVLEVPLEN